MLLRIALVLCLTTSRIEPIVTTRDHRFSAPAVNVGAGLGPRPRGVLAVSRTGVQLAVAAGMIVAAATAVGPLARMVTVGAMTLAVICALSWRVRRSAQLVSAHHPATAGEFGEASAFAWMLDCSPDAVLVTDLDGAERYRSRRFTELFGDAPWCDGARPMRAGPCRILDDEAFAAIVRELNAHADQTGGGELTVVRGDHMRVLRWSSEPVRDPSEIVVGRALVVRECAQEREAAALKNDFLSTVTHELRTPLTSIRGSLQLVLNRATALTAIERELLGISVTNTERLIRLINDILDISQLELGKMELVFADVAPAPLIEEAVAGLRAYGAGRDISISCDLEADLPIIEGDRDRLIQVLTNLISNAVKFSAVGGRVLVRAARAAGGVTIAIRDWGIGIGSADQGRLFQRFQRLRRGGSEEPGTGLGLAISKAIIDRHAGSITVESAEAEGSTFTVFVPLSSRAQLEAPISAPSQAVAAGRPTVLLVDDDADLGTVLEVSLGAGCRLLRVERGVQALDVARAERPHVILLDVVLPDLSGYDVLRILQHSEATRGIPVVMLTVRPEQELARRLGAAEVVAKPVDMDVLRAIIARVLRVRSQAAGLRVALGPLRSRATAELVAAFEAGGHAVFRADDEWGLLRCADQHDPDVAVVETQGGDATVAFLRGHPTTRRLPLVLLTDARAGGVVGAGCTPVPCAVADADLVRAVEQAARQPES